MAEDIELLRRYATDRSEPAFSALVQQHLPLVYQAALRRTNGDTQLAEEVAQTVFAELAREAATLQHHAVLTGWLYVATRHAAANAMRTELRRKAREREAHTMNELTTPTAPVAEWEQLRPEIDSAMDELSEADRNAVLLRFFENRPYAEIGASFRISEDAARMRVDRALEKLRTLLGRRGIMSTAAALGGLLAVQSAIAAPAGLATVVTGSVLAGAGAAATAAGTAGLIAFMTTNKMILGIAGAMVLAAGGTAVYEYREARHTERALAALGSDMSALKSRLAAKESEVLAEEKKRRVLEAQVATATNGGGLAPGGNRVQPPGGAVAVSGGKEPTTPPVPGRMDILYASPEYVQLELQRVALELPERYGGLYQRLGLSADQVRQFESLLLEWNQNVFDTFAAARTKGVSINDPALRELTDPAQEAVQARIKALLGSDGYGAYKAYTSPGVTKARYAVSDLTRRLYTTAPLSPEQADRLTEIIAAGTPKPKRGPGLVTETGTPDWPGIYGQAKDILSPAQLAALQAANRSTEIFLQQAQLTDRLLQEAAASAAR